MPVTVTTIRPIEGSGSDIWGSADEFQFVHLPATGDASITAQVVSQEDTHAWAKAGVMIRETTAGGSPHAMMVVTPGNGISFQRRSVAASGSSSTTQGGSTAPYWVRIERVGDTFTGSASPDGQNWTVVGSETIAMETDTLIGLAVTSHNDSVLSTVTIKDVDVVE